MEMSFMNIVTIVAGFVAFLFMIFLLSIKTERPLANYLLAFYLLVFILDTLSQFNTYYLYPISPMAGMLVSLAVFLMMPAMFLFVKSSIYRDFRLSWGSLIHLLPYVLITITLIPGYFMVHMRGDFTPEYAAEFTGSWLFILIYACIYIQIAVYFTMIFIELKKYRQLLIENYSSPNMGNFRWLMQFTMLILALDVIGLIKNILRFSSAEVIFSFASIIVVINILIFISWVLMMSLKQPGMFTGIYSDMRLVKKILTDQKDTKDSNESSQIIKQLKLHMSSNEPFLDSALSVYDLATQMDMSVRDLSLLINHTLNQHFFDFVNHYRIEKAMELLGDPENRQVTVLEVLYEVGFNSKSSFNTVFKKQTRMTPTQYRRSQSNPNS
jgi:AraC-like DNA-binding protein